MNFASKMMVSGFIAGAIGLVVPVSVFAQATQDLGWYVGGSIGQSQAKDTICVSGISCDDKDTAWRIFGGYQFHRNVAAELGYHDFGKIFTASGFGLSEEIKSKAWELSAIGLLPVANRFSLLGRLGIYRAETKDSTNFGFSAKETNTDLTFGFGVRYDFTRNLAVRAEWQRYKEVGGGDIGESDIDVLNIGAQWKF